MVSHSGNINNLDRLAAETAQKFVSSNIINNKTAKEKENTITKGLGVLQENGVYACFLYLLAKEGEIGKVAVNQMLTLLCKMPYEWAHPGDNPESILKFVYEKVSDNLEKLLLVKETLEQMLIYARYGVKAKG